MGKILEFKSKEDKKPRTKKQPPPVLAKTDHDIYQDVMEDVLGEWQAAAGRDLLNEYVDQHIPKSMKWVGSDWLTDLGALSQVEQALKMRVAIFYPGVTPANRIGWIAAFHLGRDAFTSPPDMASEAYARAICLVLFVEFTGVMKTLGRQINP